MENRNFICHRFRIKCKSANKWNPLYDYANGMEMLSALLCATQQMKNKNERKLIYRGRSQTTIFTPRNRIYLRKAMTKLRSSGESDGCLEIFCPHSLQVKSAPSISNDERHVTRPMLRKVFPPENKGESRRRCQMPLLNETFYFVINLISFHQSFFDNTFVNKLVTRTTGCAESL